jgi:hypothetical protein
MWLVLSHLRCVFRNFGFGGKESSLPNARVGASLNREEYFYLLDLSVAANVR